MSALLFSISSTSLLSKPETNSGSNDGHAHTHTHPTPQTPSSVSGHCSLLLSLLPGAKAERECRGGGSQPVRRPCSPHQFTGSRRQPCILTSLALTSSGGGGVIEKEETGLMGAQTESAAAETIQRQTASVTPRYFILGPAARLGAQPASPAMLHRPLMWLSLVPWYSPSVQVSIFCWAS